MQSVLLFWALHAKCPDYFGLYIMQSVLIIEGFTCKVSLLLRASHTKWVFSSAVQPNPAQHHAEVGGHEVEVDGGDGHPHRQPGMVNTGGHPSQTNTGGSPIIQIIRVF